MDFSAATSAQIGVAVDFSSITKLTSAAIIQSSLDFIGNELRRKELIDLMEDGFVVFGMDNVDIKNDLHIKAVNGFVSSYPKNKYIITTPEEPFENTHVGLYSKELNLELTCVYIHSFKQKHVKELTKKWFNEESSKSTDQRLHLVSKLISRLNIPSTPFLVSILLWVLEQRPNTNLVNQASAIEVLIEGLLEKLKESKSRSDYDSTIQVHFLMELASRLDSTSQEWIASIEFEEFVVNYFKTKGLSITPRGFTDELLRKGLIFEESQKIAFKFDCFRAFFLAKKFASTPDYWKAYVQAGKINRYITEFDLYTGLNRDKKDVLEAVRALCNSFSQESYLNISLDEVDRLGMEGKIFDEKKIKWTEEIIFECGEDLKNDFLEKVDVPSFASLDHNESRRRPHAELEWQEMDFLASLRVFSMVLRNGELIDDISLKMDCLKEILGLWGKFMFSLIKKLESFKNFDMKEMYIQLGISEEDVDPTASPPLGMAKLLAVLGTFSFISESLSTPKLENFVMSQDVQSSSVERVFAASIALDSTSEEAIRLVNNFFQDCKNHHLFTQAILLKLIQVYLFSPTEEYAKQLKDSIYQALSVIRGDSGIGMKNKKSRIFALFDEKRRVHQANSRDPK